MKKTVSIFILVNFLITGHLGTCPLYARDFRLPVAGVMVHLSPPFNPPILKGIKIHPNAPFSFDFILDAGEGKLGNDQLKDESSRLIKYFLASLTIPGKDLWVNLSPYEKSRIITPSFGVTEMGRDFLAEDYMLKQITASLIYPEAEAGKKFWRRIYEEASKKFGTTDISVNTFNKVWIIPEKALVYENVKAGTAYVVESKLKVMLEEDYLSLEKHGGMNTANAVNALGSQIVREIVIPQLTKEINGGNNFSTLRQIYNSLILASWYKKKMKDSILSEVYSGQNKVKGITIDPLEKMKIYQQYLKAFKKGVYNYIKEESGAMFPQQKTRKYFSGGLGFGPENMDKALIFTSREPTQNLDHAMIVEAGIEQFNEASLQVSGNQGIASMEELTRQYELKGHNLLKATVYQFEGVGGQDVYNSALFQAKITPEDRYESVIIAGRVEDRKSELSKVMFFKKGEGGKWVLIKDTPVFEASQDPAVKKIGNNFILSMVKVAPTGKILPSGAPELAWHTEFFQFGALKDLNPLQPIARGPLSMKDIRLLELQDHRILIMTRPQGESYGGNFGRGKIGYLVIKNFADLKKLAHEFTGRNKDKSKLEEMMENGKLLEGMFLSDEWGGANNLYLLENGNIGVLGHIARYDKEGNREYCPMTFEFNPDEGTVSPLKIIGRWGTLAGLLNADTVPVKQPDPQKPLDLAKVWFGTGLVTLKGRYFLFGGARDTRTVMAEMSTAPFTSPIVPIADSNWANGGEPFDKTKGGQSDYGGIDLTPDRLNLETKVIGFDRGGSKELKFYFSPAMLQKLRDAPGFVPVIITIKPMSNLRVFLGLNIYENT